MVAHLKILVEQIKVIVILILSVWMDLPVERTIVHLHLVLSLKLIVVLVHLLEMMIFVTLIQILVE